MPDFSVVREVADELKGSDAHRWRAAVISTTGRDMEASKFRLPLLSPNHFAMFDLDMVDGFLPNPDNAYSTFMSNAAVPGPDPVTNSKFERAVILTVPVMAHLAETGQGCLEQRSAVPVDDHLSLPVLQNAAVRYVISMFELESRYLRLKRAGTPVLCSTGRGRGRPFIYEFIEPASRFGLARDIAVADGIGAAYRAMRDSHAATGWS
jgi:hypothetical protein